MRRCILAAAMATFCVAGAHAGVSLPVTEDFEADAANWYDGAGAAEAGWVSSGGFDGGAYVSVTETLPDPLPPFGTTLFRAQDELNSSGGAFVGDWEAAGVTELRFMIRHNAPAPIDLFARIASPTNFPAAAALSFVPVLPNVWTEVAISLTEGSPNIIFEGPLSYSDVFGNVGHLQIGAAFSDDLAGGTFTFDLDQVVLVPSPAVLSLALLALCGCSQRRRKAH